IAEAGSFSPTQVSARVNFHSPVFLPAAWLLATLYLSLLALAGLAPLFGWGRLPGPGFVALVAGLAVIACAGLIGAALGIYTRATGQYPHMVSQLEEVRELVRSVLGSDDQALLSASVKAQRFR